MQQGGWKSEQVMIQSYRHTLSDKEKDYVDKFSQEFTSKIIVWIIVFKSKKGLFYGFLGNFTEHQNIEKTAQPCGLGLFKRFLEKSDKWVQVPYAP